MKILGAYRFLVILILGLVFVSCKSQYERIKATIDSELWYNSAQKYYEEGDYLKAQSLYEMAIPHYRGTSESEQLFFNYAYSHYYLEDYMLSAHYFKSFSNTFYGSEKAEEALFMNAMSNYMQSPEYNLDQSSTYKAIESFQLFINSYPRSERVEQSNELIDEMRSKLEKKAYHEGLLYYRMRQYVSAVNSFQNMLVDFPETEKAEELRYMTLESQYQYAINSIYEKQADRLEQTLGMYDVFIKKHPESKYLKEATRIKNITEKSLKKIK